MHGTGSSEPAYKWSCKCIFTFCGKQRAPVVGSAAFLHCTGKIMSQMFVGPQIIVFSGWLMEKKCRNLWQNDYWYVCCILLKLLISSKTILKGTWMGLDMYSILCFIHIFLKKWTGASANMCPNFQHPWKLPFLRFLGRGGRGLESLRIGDQPDSQKRLAWVSHHALV